MWFKSILKTIIPSKYHKGLNKILRVLSIENMPEAFIDSYSWINQEHITISKAFINTTKYKFAGIGLALTQNEKKMLELQNFYTGQRTFILGNGPSLNKCDLSFLKNETTFGVNNIFLNYEKMGFHPTYYVVEDTLVAEDRAAQINAYHGMHAKFFGNYLQYCIDSAPDVIWLNVRVNYSEYEEFPHFSTNAARMVWVGGTVSYICMQLAFYMGFKDVYLLGFDHSYKIPSDAIVNGQKKEITSESGDPNHFDPEYFGKGYRWHDPMVDRMEMAYRRANQIFQANHRHIFNATVGGNLTIFPRVNYDDLFISA